MTTKIPTYKELEKIIDLYEDSEHPINEILSALKNNIYYEFYDEVNKGLNNK